MTNDTPTTCPPTVLVLGARGRLGLAAAQAFARRGWRVLAQARRAPDATSLPEARWLVQAIDTPAQRAALVDQVRRLGGAQVLVHGLNPVRYTRRDWEREALPLMHTGIAVARELGAHLLLPGNVYAYGRSLPAVLDGHTPVRPDTAMGRLRQAMEDALRAATQRGELRATVIRAGNFYGQGRGTWLDQAMLTGIRRGRLVYPGPLDVATPWAWLPDLAQTFVAVAGQRDRLDAFATVHVEGHTLTGHDWVRALQPLAEVQGWVRPGRALRVSTLPWGLIGAVGLVKPDWAALAEARHLWTRPHRLSNAGLPDALGDAPATPFADALAHTLADLGLLPAHPVTPAAVRLARA